MKQVNVAIIGASGYSGEELVRLLLHHTGVNLSTLTSRQHSGKTISEVFPKFSSHPKSKTLRFADPDPNAIAGCAEIVFLALPHGVASEFAVPLIERGLRVIDLSADFRVRNPSVYAEFYGSDHPAPSLLEKGVYGLPEVYRKEIKNAQLVASPGCYPTSILFPTIPLLRAGFIKPSGIIADSLSGVSGAGRKVSEAFLFVECNESMRPYGVPKHRHLSEIEQELAHASGSEVTIQFTPHLIPVNRGILTTLYLSPKEHFENEAGARELSARIGRCLKDAYQNEPFVRLLEGNALPDTKNVTGTNVIEIAWRLDARTGRLIVMSAVDNILKGASGQAVQSMNMMCGFPETLGLT